MACAQLLIQACTAHQTCSNLQHMLSVRQLVPAVALTCLTPDGNLRLMRNLQDRPRTTSTPIPILTATKRRLWDRCTTTACLISVDLRAPNPRLMTTRIEWPMSFGLAANRRCSHVRHLARSTRMPQTTVPQAFLAHICFLGFCYLCLIPCTLVEFSVSFTVIGH